MREGQYTSAAIIGTWLRRDFRSSDTLAVSMTAAWDLSNFSCEISRAVSRYPNQERNWRDRVCTAKEAAALKQLDDDIVLQTPNLFNPFFPGTP